MKMEYSDLKISTIIPAYNSQDYIGKCIESVLNQKFLPIEIIIVDDGSKDNTVEICKEYEKKYDIVKLVEMHKNQGVSIARNTGIKIAEGNYIHFMDSDDTIENNMYSDFKNILKEVKADVIISGIKNIYEKNNKIVLEEPKTSDLYNKFDDIANFLKDICVKEGKIWALNVIWNKLYRKDVIISNDIIFNSKINLGEDFIFNCNFFTNINSIQIVNKSYYNYYRRDNNSLVSKFRTDIIKRRKLIYSEWEKLYKKYNLYDECKEDMQKYEGYLMYNNLYTIFSKNCKLSSAEKKSFLKELLESENINFVYFFFNGKKKYEIERKLMKAKKIDLLYYYMLVKIKLMKLKSIRRRT